MLDHIHNVGFVLLMIMPCVLQSVKPSSSEFTMFRNLRIRAALNIY